MKIYPLVMLACLATKFIVGSDERYCWLDYRPSWHMIKGNFIHVKNGIIIGSDPAQETITLTCGAYKIRSDITFRDSRYSTERYDKINKSEEAFAVLVQHRTTSEVNGFSTMYPGENNTIVCLRARGPGTVFNSDGTVQR